MKRKRDKPRPSSGEVDDAYCETVQTVADVADAMTMGQAVEHLKVIGGEPYSATVYRGPGAIVVVMRVPGTCTEDTSAEYALWMQSLAVPEDGKPYVIVNLTTRVVGVVHRGIPSQPDLKPLHAQN
jgi:hypothetical protein